jgi:hypothetical protein
VVIQPATRRGTWLRPIRVILAVLIVLNIAWLPLLLLSGYDTGPIAWVMPFGELLQSDEAVRIRYPDLAVRHVLVYGGTEHPPTSLRLLMVSRDYLALALVIIPILVYARHVTYHVLYDDEPFSTATVKRLRRLGFMVLGGGVLVEIARYVAARLVVEIALPAALKPYAEPVYELQTWWVLLGLVILAVSALIKHGVALRHEVDGVV